MVSQFIELFGDLSQNTKSYPIKKLSDIADYWNGLTYKPADAVESGAGTLVLRSSNIQNGELAFDDNVYVSCVIKEKLFVQDNDILMCSRNGSAALVGKTALIKGLKEPITFGAFMMIVRSKYYPYLKTYFELPFFRNQISTGTSTINQITGKMLNDIQLPVPDMDTINEFENFVYQSDKSKFISFKSQFIEMFGDPIENPNGLPVLPLKELTSKLGSGATPKGGNASYKDEGISLIRSMHIYNGYFDYEDLAHIDEVQAKKLENVTVLSGDVLLNITGASVARSCIVPDDILPARVNQHVCIIRCLTDRILPVFLNRLLIGDSYQALLWNIAEAAGATRQALTKEQIENLQIIIPSIEQQEEYIRIAEQSDKSK